MSDKAKTCPRPRSLVAPCASQRQRGRGRGRERGWRSPFSSWRRGVRRFNLSGMDPLLKLLHENAALKPAQLAALLNLSEPEVTAKIKAYENAQVILGYRTVLNE